MSLKAVLFDAGDTLFRVRGSVGEVYAAFAARHGVPVTAPQIERRFRTAFRGMPPLSFPGASDADLPRREYAWWQELVAAVFGDTRFADFDAFFAELFGHFAQPAGWELFPDTVPALAALRARGLHLAIVSNFDGRLLRICEGLGIASSFDTIVMSSRVGAAKPDPRIFAEALARLAVSASEAIHVGDGDAEDIQGASAAGIRAVKIDRNVQPPDAEQQVRDLRHLLRLVER